MPVPEDDVVPMGAVMEQITMFRIVKCQFGYRKTRFRGLDKNIAQLKALFGLGNLYLLRKKLMQLPSVNCAQGA